MSATTRAASPNSLIRRLSLGRLALAILASGAMVAAPLPALAATPATPSNFFVAPTAAPSQGKVVGLMRFGGDAEMASSMRAQVQADLETAGYTVKGVALDINAAADKVKCRGGADACIGKVADWLLKGAKAGQTYDFLVYGDWSTAPGQRGTLVIYDVAQKTKVTELSPASTVDDQILKLAFPRALAERLRNYQSPPPPATEDELKLIAELDEPAKTPEELRAEAERIQKAQAGIDTGMGDAVDTSNISVDLKKDFKEYCRTGPRKPKVDKDSPKDLSPACKLGPKFGYFQTRAWVALGLTAGAFVASGVFYSLGLAARGPYKSAVKTLEDSNADPNNPTMSAAYTALASDAAAKGNSMRRRFIGGDVALLTGILLGAVLGVIIYQDRTDAKEFLKQEKSLKAISKTRPRNFRGGPIVGAGMQGVSFGFEF